MRIDLHNHSNYSDGRLSVKEVVDLAKSQNLNVFALTDHDSCFGVDEAFEYGKEKGIYVLKGLELSTFYKNDPIHIVCLFKKNKVSKEFYDYSKNIIDTRISRAKKMMENVRDIFNVKIDLDDLFKESTIVTRGNMQRSLEKSNPNISKEEIWDMLSNDSKAYIPSVKLDTLEGLTMAKKYGATCILAHPTLVKRENLLEIIDFGFDGIEARYPLNKEGEEAYFTNLAKEHNLFISAGSDFHGDTKHAMIGTSYLNGEEFKIIKDILELGDEINEN